MSMRPGDWKCPKCGTVNFAKRTDCRNGCAGVVRGADAGPPAPKPGDWKCACGTNNFASRSVCFSCQRSKPAATPSAAMPPASASSAASTPKLRPGDWQCPQCNTVNFKSRTTCRNNCPRNDFQSMPHSANVGGDVSDPSMTMKTGDWTCNHCHVNNFASRTQCYKCQQPKGSMPSAVVPSTNNSDGNPATSSTTGGVVPSSTSTRPGDWNCSQCSFSNFGTRTQCFSCGNARVSALGGGSAPGGTDADETAGVLKTFATPSYWKSDANSFKPELCETGYFNQVAATLWRKFASVTNGRPIRQVVRIENVALWHGYCAEVQRLVAKYPNQAAPMTPNWQPETLRILDDTYHINETYLLHGTSPAVAKLIVDGGFDPSHSGEAAGALFGQGTYFSDSLKKVMNYSKGCVVVARVALGEVAEPPHKGSTSSYRRPPMKPNGTEEFDSLVATAHSGLKEFIVYRHTKAYPEYLIYHD